MMMLERGEINLNLVILLLFLIDFRFFFFSIFIFCFLNDIQLIVFKKKKMIKNKIQCTHPDPFQLLSLTDAHVTQK